MRLVIDSYAWVELFRGSEKGERVKQLILDAEESRTPDIVLAEISRKYHREKIDSRKTKARLNAMSHITLVTPMDVHIALESGISFVELFEKARKEKLASSPSLFDAIVLATARVCGSKVVTGDQHFRNLPETIMV